MLVADYDYTLPEELIAKYPLPDRAASRLLVASRATRSWEDKHFANLLQYLRAGDVLVLNETRVIPARLFGKRTRTGANIEVFLHQRLEGPMEEWRVLVRPGRKVKEGEQIAFSNDVVCVVLQELGEGERIVRFETQGRAFLPLVEAIGNVPLPPYLNREAEASDRERYQTVFAREPGAVAAPTAGLHFTPELLRAIELAGVAIARVVLHTGIGTFRPVEVEHLEDHVMHEEYYEVTPEAAQVINARKQAGGRVFAVGTTTVRTLETAAAKSGIVEAGSGMSGIFIYPPYEFKVPDAIVTNFHMPRSTLLMMISAFAGKEFILACYEHAKRQRYRFFSYGDAMLIL